MRTAPFRADSSRQPVVALYACWSAALEQLQSISTVQHWLACLVSQCPSCACHGGLVLRCFYKVCVCCAMPSRFVTAACRCTVRWLVDSPGTAAVHFNGATLVCVPSQPVSCACHGGLVLRCFYKVCVYTPCRADSSRPPVVALYACWSAALEQLQSISTVQHWLACLVSQCPSCACHGGLVLRCFYKVCVYCAMPCGFVTAACCCTVRLLVGSPGTAAVHFNGATLVGVPSQPVPQLRLPRWPGVTVLLQSLCVHAMRCGFVTAACCCTVRLLVGSPGTAAVHFNSATLVGVPSQPVPQLRLPWWPGVTVLLQSLCVHAMPCGFVTAACCCTVRLLVGSPGTAAVHFNGATLVGVPSQPVPQLRLPRWPGVTVLLQSLCALRHAVQIRHGRLSLHCTLVGRQPWNSCSPVQQCKIGQPLPQLRLPWWPGVTVLLQCLCVLRHAVQIRHGRLLLHCTLVGRQPWNSCRPFQRCNIVWRGRSAVAPVAHPEGPSTRPSRFLVPKSTKGHGFRNQKPDMLVPGLSEAWCCFHLALPVACAARAVCWQGLHARRESRP